MGFFSKLLRKKSDLDNTSLEDLYKKLLKCVENGVDNLEDKELREMHKYFLTFGSRINRLTKIFSSPDSLENMRNVAAGDLLDLGFVRDNTEKIELFIKTAIKEFESGKENHRRNNGTQ